MTITRTQLLDVAFPAEFPPGARNAVTTCLRIQPTEKVTLITDRGDLEIAASIARELERSAARGTPSSWKSSRRAR